jgi:ubiquinone/menaquinone biosynthesis C-methylase UbiE
MPFYDFWRNKSVTALGRSWTRQAARYTLGRIRANVTPLKHIVEIGPGRGVFMQACKAACLRYTALDANLGFLQGLDHAATVHAVAPQLPLGEGVADAVVATHVIEHLPDMPRATSFLAEMARITRPGGLVVVTAPDLLWYGGYFYDCDYSHNFPTSARRLHQMFLDQRLEVVCLEYVFNHLTGWPGVLAGLGARMIPYAAPGALPTSALYNDRIYKSRLTFARGVFIIGRRV